MKKYFGLFFLFGMFLMVLTSCLGDKDDDGMEEMAEGTTMDSLVSGTQEAKAHLALLDSTVTNYPQAIDDYLALNYPGLVLIIVSLEEDGNYEVELEGGLELLFDVDGNFLEEEIEMDDEEDDENKEDEDEEEEEEDD